MPELPEITLLARQMKQALTGRTITGAEILQPKCLNVTPRLFKSRLAGAQVRDVSHRGKWVRVETDRGWLLLCLGMGGEILLVTRDTLPEKRRLILDLDGNQCLAINFWWFGYAHYAQPGQIDRHTMTARLGPNALDLSLDEFRALLAGRRGQLKMFLLDQDKIAGIGNFYVHDILFLARLHPLRAIDSLAPGEIDNLYQAIHAGLEPSIAKGGAFYEMNLYGQKGSFTLDDIQVGYKENRPCPVCGTEIVKIKTGGTSSFICPHCQALAAARPSAKRAPLARRKPGQAAPPSKARRKPGEAAPARAARKPRRTK